MYLRTRVIASVFALSVFALSLGGLPQQGWAQGADAIDSLLSRGAPEQNASREDAADAPSDPAMPESWLAFPTPASAFGRTPAVAPASDAICRVMTDMAQRSRRERICMPRAGWEALIRVAKGTGARAAGGARLKLAYRSRRER